MANLSHAKRRALRAAILTGGLVRADSGLFDNPQAPSAFYQPATIVGLVIRHVDADDLGVADFVVGAVKERATFSAWALGNGVIGIGETPPVFPVARVFATGDEQALRQMVEVTSRHAHDRNTYLVPGIPEAANSIDAMDALLDWCDWLAQGNRGVEITLAGQSKDGRSTSDERFIRTAAMLAEA